MLLLIHTATLTLHADTFGDFAYTDDGASITITGIASTTSGAVDIPASIVGKPVTTIGVYAFYQRNGLTNITIPNSVTSIESGAFSESSGLTSVTIPNSVTSIGYASFYGCTGLTNVVIPNSVTSIIGSTFQGCTSLANVTMPNSVTSIGEYMFYGCTALTSIVIPSSVISIGVNAFSNCQKLRIIYFRGNAPTLGVTPVFTANSQANVYYLAGTTGWTNQGQAATYGGLNTVVCGFPVMTITGPPFGVIANLGENANFFVIAKTTIPFPLSYQWQRNGLSLLGATASSLYLGNIQSANVGTYTVTITADVNSITSSPVTLTLNQGTFYTQAQYDAALQTGLTAGLQAGINQVTGSPNSYGLYSLNQVQALNVGTPLLTKDQVSGQFKLTIKAKKSSNLSAYTPLPFAPGETTINSQGELEFKFTSPDNAAFFRLESF